MRRFCLVTTLALMVSLVGCSHQQDHVCGPTCCERCCEAQAGTAAEAATQGGMSAAEWAAKAEGADAWTRQEVIVNLAAFGPSSLCFATDWMGSEDPVNQYAGAELARMIGAHAGPAVPALRTLLRSDDANVRVGALRALAQLSMDDLAPAVHDIGHALDADEWEVRYHAARALASTGHKGSSELEHLEHRSRHDLDPRVRSASASAFEIVDEATAIEEKNRRGRAGN